MELNTYLKEIGRVKLLTHEEEIALAKRIRKGDVEAKKHFIAANLRLVVREAKRYTNRGLCFGDLVGYGNLALIRAVETYNPKFGTRFSTHAVLRIHRGLQHAIADHHEGRAFRVAKTTCERLEKLHAAQMELLHRQMRDPTPGELASHMKLPVSTVETILHGDAAHRKASLANIPTDPAYQEREPEWEVDDIAKLRDATRFLSRREWEVIASRFGIGRPAITLVEVGKEHCISKERVRQVESLALKKLRQILVEGK